MGEISKALSRGRLSAEVINFVNIMKKLVDKGRSPGFTREDWAPLAEYIAKDEFIRVGPFHDALNWDEYEAFLTGWVTTSEGWNPVAKRINEAPGIVYLELDEMVTDGDRTFPFHSLSIYEFNDAGKINRIDVYMQQPTDRGSPTSASEYA